MPSYEYLCVQCGEEFIRVMTISERETAKVTCPKCKSENIKQQLSPVITKTSRKS
jgi:putative FmdB family regulatory protein